MAKKETVKISANVRKLKNLDFGERFRVVSNKGNVSSKVYTKEEYDRKSKKYDVGNSSKKLKGDTKVITYFGGDCYV